MMGEGFSNITTRGGEDFPDVTMSGTQTGTHQNGANQMRTSHAQGVKKGSQKATRADNYESFAVQNISGATREQRITQSFGSLSWLACLRRSALSLRPQASSTHAEKLAFGLSAFSLSTLASISSTRLCGKRIPLYAVLLVIWDFAISTPHKCLNDSEDTAKNRNMELFKHIALTCLNSVDNLFKQLDEIWLIKTAKPAGATNTNGLLTTNVIETNEVAMSNRITPRKGRAALGPNKFTWRFLALGATGSTVIHITATAEHEARKQSPAGFVLIFAGRLPVQEVRHA